MAQGAKTAVVALAGVVALGAMGAALGPIVYRGMVVAPQDVSAVRPTMLTPGGSQTSSDTGSWIIAEDSWATYRLADLRDEDEELIGRTNRVTGGIVIEDGVITEAAFRVDLATLRTGDAGIDSLLERIAPATSAGDTAELVVTGAHAAAVFGDTDTVTLDGTLRFRDVAQPVSVELRTQLEPDGGAVVGSIPVRLEDFASVEPLRSAGATVELSLTLRRSDEP